MEHLEIEPMMTRHQVAEYLSRVFAVSEREVYDRWVYLPDFPKAVLLPTMGRVPPKRYVRLEIIGCP